MANHQIPIIKAPTVLCLYTNADEVTLFFNKLYEKAPVLRLDFSATQEITAAAALALFAHVNNIQQGKKNMGCFVFDCKKSRVYKTHFIKTGFLNALKKGSCDTNYLFRLGSFDSLTEVRNQTFSQLDEFKLQFERGQQLANTEIDDFFIHLRQAIKEALLNITNHAYFSDEPPDNEGYDHYRDKMWWQMFWYAPDTKKIHFIIYDLGVGIVSSYVNHATKKRAASYHSLPALEILQEALKPGMSRMIDDGRGMGWSFIAQSIDNLEASSLFLRTGISGCHFKNDKEPKWIQYQHGLSGTLVEWSFQLPIKES